MLEKIDLLEMMQYRRPHLSKGLLKFCEIYLKPQGIKQHESGNWLISVGDPKSTTLFSCHLDTVHQDDDKQRVLYDVLADQAFKDDGKALGADDAAGVWIMLNMVMEGVPGTYVFHVGEERGGLGSREMAQKFAPFLRLYDRAVAFDRRGYSSIITHQGGRRCCSDKFAEALATQMKDYRLDKTGLFTDTANYTNLIRECTNLSVGYQNEHGGQETLDLTHVCDVLDMALKVEWEELPTVREFHKEEPNNKKTHFLQPAKGMPPETEEEELEVGYRDLVVLCQEDPYVAALLLMEQNITEEEIDDARDLLYAKIEETDEDKENNELSRSVPLGELRETLDDPDNTPAVKHGVR